MHVNTWLLSCFSLVVVHAHFINKMGIEVVYIAVCNPENKGHWCQTVSDDEVAGAETHFVNDFYLLKTLLVQTHQV